jgi:putative glutamine amidotransferase
MAKSLLNRITGRLTIRVNSSHHQSVKTPAPGLIASAVSPDGVIEAVESPRKRFVLGVQWHPEFLYDRDAIQRKLFTAFIKAARDR